MGDRLKDGGLGYRVERHAFDSRLAQRLLLAEHFQHMPGNGLALAIGVGGQDQLARTLQGVDDVLDTLLGPVVDLPGHGEVVVRLYRPVLGGQVADMAKTGQNLVARAQILIDRSWPCQAIQRREHSCGTRVLYLFGARRLNPVSLKKCAKSGTGSRAGGTLIEPDERCQP